MVNTIGLLSSGGNDMVNTIFEGLKAVGTVIAGIGLYLAYRQLRASIRWNRINATFTYLPEAVYIERERAAAEAMKTIGIDLYQQELPIERKTVDQIFNDSQVFKEAKDFLNMFETYAAAYKANAVDRDHSYGLNASQFIRYYVVFKPFIYELRSRRKNNKFWMKFERLVQKDWLERQEKEIEELARAQDKTGGYDF